MNSSSAPPRPHQVLEPGHRLDRYELLCVLAQGGMASVWLARMRGKHGFEKLVAVKTILPDFATDPHFQQMFLDEARIASGIEHPNVVQILDLGDQHGTLYLVMELVDGDPLQRLHRSCEKSGIRIPTGIILRILSDACAGLHAAHELRNAEGRPLRVVHRDVSPQNILVATNGTAKVIDFGIAKARERGNGDTSAGTLKGKVQFMSREQATGAEIDCTADVWAMGAVLYFLLTGRAPHEEGTQVATLTRLLHGAPIPPLPANIPGPVAALTMRALDAWPERRFQSATEMRMAIDATMKLTNMVTSSDDVAAFVSRHLQVRAEGRKKAIERALQEAAHRHTAHAVLNAPPELQTQPSGIHGVAPQRATPVGTFPGVGPRPSTMPPARAAHSAPPTTPPGYAGHSGPPHRSTDGSSPGTLGSAEIGIFPLQRTSRTAPALAVAVGVITTLAIAGVVAFAIFSMRVRHATAAGPAPPIERTSEAPIAAAAPDSTIPLPEPAVPATGHVAADTDPAGDAAPAPAATQSQPAQQAQAAPIKAQDVAPAPHHRTPSAPSTAATTRPATPQKVQDFGF